MQILAQALRPMNIYLTMDRQSPESILNHGRYISDHEKIFRTAGQVDECIVGLLWTDIQQWGTNIAQQDDHETVSSSEFSDGAVILRWRCDGADFHFEQFKGVHNRSVHKKPWQERDNGHHSVGK